MRTFSEFLSENIHIPYGARKIKVNAKDIHKICSDKSRVENDFLWTNGKDILDMKQWSKSYPEDGEVFPGKGVKFKIEMFVMDLSNVGKENFIAGFKEVAPKTYDYNSDIKRVKPFCKPWLWADYKEWFNSRISAEQMGKNWFWVVERVIKNYGLI